MSAFIDDSNTDFTDTWILNELYDQLTQLYERAVVNSQQGFWLKTQIQLITAGVEKYRIPRRCVAGGLHRVQIAYDNTLAWMDLPEVDETQAQVYELQSGQTDQPVRWCMRGDTITLLPKPNAQAYALRIFYYLKPSRLVPPQLSSNSGRINTVDTSTRIITFTNPLVSYDPTGATSAMTAGTWYLDIIEGTGQSNIAAEQLLDQGGNWHEVAVVGEPAVAGGVGLNFTFSNTSIDLSNVKPGDYARAYVQSEWPCLPEDFHRSLADAAAVKILRMRSMDQKAAVLEATLAQDLARFGDLLEPRVQNYAKPIVAPRMYRGQRRNWLVRYP